MTLDWSETPETSLSVRGRELEYAAFGPSPEHAPTIVMLHEGLGCVALWRDFPRLVSEATGMGVLAYSRMGYGKSDPVDLPRPIDFMTREAMDVLPEVLDQIGFQRGILFGHSDGATIAAIHSGSLADMRVRGLIVMAPHFFTEPDGLNAITEARIAYETGDLRDKMAKYHNDPDNAFYGWNETWLRDEFRDWDVSDVIDYLRIPTLAIQGRDDQYGTLKQIEVIEERSYAPVELLVLDGCTHAPHQEKPEAVLAAVSEFAERLMRIEAAEVEQAKPMQMPPFAYVPGKTPRHDEETFEAYHASVTGDMSLDQIVHSLAWRAGWIFVESGYFWEAHEVLEPVWMALRDGSAEKRFVQGIIQLANAELKWRMGKPNAVRRLCDIAEDLLSAPTSGETVMGLAAAAPLDRIKALRAKANHDVSSV